MSTPTIPFIPPAVTGPSQVPCAGVNPSPATQIPVPVAGVNPPPTIQIPAPAANPAAAQPVPTGTVEVSATVPVPTGTVEVSVTVPVPTGTVEVSATEPVPVGHTAGVPAPAAPVPVPSLVTHAQLADVVAGLRAEIAAGAQPVVTMPDGTKDKIVVNESNELDLQPVDEN